MNLNGWERIGVVASVIWLLAVFTFAGLERWGEVLPPHTSHFVEFVPDQSKQPQVWIDPDSGEPRRFREVNSSLLTSKVLGEAFLPIAISWLLIYSISCVVRWIRRGFPDAT